jgi:hypothetical protein
MEMFNTPIRAEWQLVAAPQLASTIGSSHNLVHSHVCVACLLHASTERLSKASTDACMSFCLPQPLHASHAEQTLPVRCNPPRHPIHIRLLLRGTGVTSICRSLAEREKRFASFYVKAALDLGTSLDLSLKMKLPAINPTAPYLTEDDLAHPLDPFEVFPSIALRAACRVAAFYGASISDTLAVSPWCCGGLPFFLPSSEA